MADPRATPRVAGRPVSPAAHLVAAFAAAAVEGDRAVRLRELPFATMIGMRLVHGSLGWTAVEHELATALPTRCGEVAESADGSVIWMSPDEFLLVSRTAGADLVPKLAAALTGAPGAVVDLAANRTVLELAGPSARAVLEKGCALDLHPRAFAAGDAYLTVLGPVPVILWKTGAEEFWILPRSSFADYLGRWLIDAMAEFAVADVEAHH